jgi:hypothetical protein
MGDLSRRKAKKKKGLGLNRRKSYEKRVDTSIGEKAKKKRVVDLK